MRKVKILFILLIVSSLFLGCNSYQKIDIASSVDDVDLTKVSMVVAHVPGKPDLEKVVFIHRRAPAKGNAGGTTNGESSHYRLTGVKWTQGESYYVQQNASIDLSGVISAAFVPWNSAESAAPVFTDSNTSLLPEGAAYGLNVDEANTIAIADTSVYGADTLAVTQYVYNRRTRETVEFDQVYNQGINWVILPEMNETPVNVGESFDLPDVATHEHGHIFGLSDLYNGKDKYLTMYGYAAPGETLKRTLGSGDVAGIKALY